MRIFFVFMLGLCPSLPLAAAETPWQDLASNARARLISTDQLSPQGTTMAALQVEMPASVKTYWRVPGETGIPTEIAVSGSAGDAVRTFFPYPQIDSRDGFLDFVYYGPITVPFEIPVGDAASISLTVTMGICSDICVPAKAEFTLPLHFAQADRANGLRIRQALATTPLAWESEPSPIGPVKWSAAEGGLLVPIDPQVVDAASLIGTLEGGAPLLGAPQKSLEPDLILLPLLGNNEALASPPEKVTLTFMTAAGPYEIENVPVAQP